MTSDQGQVDEKRVLSRQQQIDRLERKLERTIQLPDNSTTQHSKLLIEKQLRRLRENLHNPKSSRGRRARSRNRTQRPLPPAPPAVIDRTPWPGLWQE